MIDISEKKAMKRTAAAEGKIILKKETIDAIKNKHIKKGDVFEASKIAGISAVKNTPQILAYCHQIPIESVKIDIKIINEVTLITCEVKATAKTGVEMEALVGVTTALNTIWDMVKYLEKDESGNYPDTKITDIKVVKKVKENA